MPGASGHRRARRGALAAALHPADRGTRPVRRQAGQDHAPAGGPDRATRRTRRSGNRCRSAGMLRGPVLAGERCRRTCCIPFAGQVSCPALSDEGFLIALSAVKRINLQGSDWTPRGCGHPFRRMAGRGRRRAGPTPKDGRRPLKEDIFRRDTHKALPDTDMFRNHYIIAQGNASAAPHSPTAWRHLPGLRHFDETKLIDSQLRYLRSVSNILWRFNIGS